MQENSWHILSTRPLSDDLIATAAQHHIAIDTLSFIQTEPTTDIWVFERVRELAAQNITAVFTSMNAVEVVTQHVKQKVAWTIYSIGDTTKKLVEQKLQNPIRGTAEYAGQLADIIIKDGVNAVVFFCGNIRRDMLPDKLTKAGIKVEELVVYNTIETSRKIASHYDAILFYSPSAVRSFFAANIVPATTKLFAIGTTTAQAIQPYTNNNVIVAEKTSKEELVHQAIAYFSQQKIN
jgi:uroporphyrinogen-III synthase